MTFTELVADVKLGLSEEVEAFFTDANISTYLIKAIKRFTKKTKCAIFQQNITFVTGTSNYALTLPVLKMRAIVINDNKTPLLEIAYEDWARITDTMKYDNNVCYVKGTSNEIYVPPAFDSGTLYVEYYAKANDATAADFINNGYIKDEYHEAITDYALYLAFRKDQEMSMSSAHLQSYLNWEKMAIKEVEMEEQNPYSNDWDGVGANPHRNDTFFQDRII